MTLELTDFLEQQILPRYQAFDKAHNTGHAIRVIRSSLVLARQLGADEDMAYTVAAYHDLGLEGPRAIHHITSGKILLADQRLRRWFSEKQIKIMKEAVEDHRASASHAPRSIYGKIVAEADRELDPDTVMKRTVLYGLDHYPEYSLHDQWLRFRQHLKEKYSSTGYIKLWIPGSPNEKNLNTLRNIIADDTLLKQAFERIMDEVKNEK